MEEKRKWRRYESLKPLTEGLKAEPSAFQKDCQEYINKVVEKYYEEVEKLTRRQFEEVLSQAIKSGDFIRCVDAMGSHTGMMYKPYYKLGIIEGIIKYHAELAECVCDSTIPIGACLKCDLDRVIRECEV